MKTGNHRQNKQLLLIVDDSEMNRAILSDMLEDEFQTLEAENGEQAIALLQKYNTHISLVLLDIVMPKIDGFDVLAVMNKFHWIDSIPVIIISAENAQSNVALAYELGVTDFIQRPYDELVVRQRVMNTIMLYAKQKRLTNMVADQIYQKQKDNSLMISILSHIVEFRNGESGLHVVHIRTITGLLLKHLLHKTDRYHFSASDISMIATASALHDIGKISISDEILNKPGRFTKEEFEIMKAHTTNGAAMLSALPLQQSEPLLQIAYEICRWHHERYDGRGYPDGLVGDEIPISAQVVSLADVYDALTSERVYKPAFSHETALRMIQNGECGVFNPLLLECLLECAETIRTELNTDPFTQEEQVKINDIMNEMLQHEELSVSERTLRQLDYERTKHRFFSSLSSELLFEYTDTPPMLTLSGRAPSVLGLDSVILNPAENPKVREIINSEAVRQLLQEVRQATQENPTIQLDFSIRLNQRQRSVRAICSTTQQADEGPQYTGIFGKLIFLDENPSENS